MLVFKVPVNDAAAGAIYDVGGGLATGALDVYDRYFREAIHPHW
ncbi:hypothetical protein [Arthrobacter sp. 24S4-2]|nr:hypothetical protein [Arthrobacter sp. 24S4-2]